MTDDTTLADSAEAEKLEPATTDDAPAPEKAEQDDKTSEVEAKGDGTTEPKSEKSAKESDQTAAEKPKRKSRAKERINELTGRARSAEREVESKSRELERLNERLKSYEGAQPKEADFETHEEYMAALTAHQVKQANKKEREADAKEATDAIKDAELDALRLAKSAFDERADDFAETATDYYSVVTDTNPPLGLEAAKQVVRSDKGPEIAYFLAKNPKEMKRLAGFHNPMDVAREIGRIEGRLTAPAPKRVTTAPDPVGAVAKGSGSQSEFDAEKATPAEMESYLKQKGVLV